MNVTDATGVALYPKSCLSVCLFVLLVFKGGCVFVCVWSLTGGGRQSEHYYELAMKLHCLLSCHNESLLLSCHIILFTYCFKLFVFHIFSYRFVLFCFVLWSQ